MTPFDKNIKKRLDNYDSPYSDDMWSRIANGLPEKKKRPFPFWITTTLILATMAALLGFFAEALKMQSNSNLPLNSNPQKVELAESTSPKTNKEEFTNTFSETGIESGSNDESDLEAVPNNQSSGEGTVSMMEGSEIRKKKNGNIVYAATSESSSVIKSRQKRDLSKESSSLTIDMRKSVNSKFANAMKAIMSKRQHSVSLGRDMESINESSHNAIQERRDESELTSVPMLVQGEDFSIEKSKNNAKLLSDLRHSMSNISLDCPTFINQAALPGISLYYSSDYSLRTFSDRSQGEGTDVLDKRQKSESFLYSYSAGMLIDVLKKKGTTLQLGVNYSLINQRFKQSTTQSNQVRSITVVDYIIVDGTVVDSIVTYEKVVIPGTLEITHYNKYKSVDIPILLNRRVGHLGKVSFSVTGGALINLLFTQEGRILGPNKSYPEYIGNGIETNPYKTNTGISAFGSVSMNYALLPNMDIFVAPCAKYTLSGVTNNQYLLNEKHITIGLMTGIKINI